MRYQAAPRPDSLFRWCAVRESTLHRLRQDKQNGWSSVMNRKANTLTAVPRHVRVALRPSQTAPGPTGPLQGLPTEFRALPTKSRAHWTTSGPQSTKLHGRKLIVGAVDLLLQGLGPISSPTMRFHPCGLSKYSMARPNPAGHTLILMNPLRTKEKSPRLLHPCRSGALNSLEGVTGIEPASPAWKAGVIATIRHSRKWYVG